LIQQRETRTLRPGQLISGALRETREKAMADEGSMGISGPHSGKRIKAVSEVGVNYLYHLLAVARINFDSDYGEKYNVSVRPEDVAFLRDHEERLSYGKGSGELLNILLLPASFGLQSKGDLQEYYDLLLRGCDLNDFTEFLDRYSSPLDKFKEWVGSLDNTSLREYIPLRDDISRLRDIVVRNYDRYVGNVWPQELPDIEDVAAVVTETFAQFDRIGQWEEITGRTFKFNEYLILMCSAIKNGPNANSLAYDRVVFYSGTQMDKMVDFICHEIGTHIFMDDIKIIRDSGEFSWPDLYEGFECLAQFYNTLILGRNDLHYSVNFHVDEYMKIYGELYHPNITVVEMLEKGIERYLATASR
jgi:hypothetical protein